MYFHRILLVPGFCEPRFALLPLRNALKDQADLLEIWNDRPICRDIGRSISNLRADLLRDQSWGRTVAVVTHSFGDWLVRQAIADIDPPPIVAFVSIAPVMAPGIIARLLRCVTGRLVSEVNIFADPDQASMNLLIDHRIDRLIVWASCDAWVSRVDVEARPNQEIVRKAGTHMSLILQPSVHRLVKDRLSKAFDRAE